VVPELQRVSAGSGQFRERARSRKRRGRTMNDGMQQQQGSWQHRSESGRREHSPARAALCALVMGLGAVYNREYTKAVVHFAIFAGLVTLADSVGEFFGFAAFVFYLFTIMDAYRSAE